MGSIDHLGSGTQELSELYSRIRALEMATPLSNASVGRGRLRMYDGSELLIEDGNFRVTGTGTVEGTLEVTGTVNVSGTTNLDGPVAIDGPTEINGTMTVSGGGKILLGGLSLEPSDVGSGAINFMPTGGISAGFGDITLVSPDLTTIVVIGHDGITVNGRAL